MSVIEQVIEQVSSFLSGTQTDVLIFIISIGVHAVLFSRHRTGKKFKGVQKVAPIQASARVRDAKEELAVAQVAATIREASSSADALQVLQQAVKKGIAGPDVLLAAMAMATESNDAKLAEAAVKQMPVDPPKEVAAAALRLCTANGPLVAADEDVGLLQFYSRHLQGADISGNAAAERRLVSIAARRNDTETLVHVLAGAAEHARRQASIFKVIVSEQGFSMGRSVFTACSEKTTTLYSAFWEVCINAKDIVAAEQVMNEAAEANRADPAIFLGVAKAFIQKGDGQRARSALRIMHCAGVVLTSSDFQELIEASSKGDEIWGWVDEMRSCGVQPNGAVCGLVLKYAQRSMKTSDTERAVKTMENIADAMNEALFSALCDLCIQTRCSHLLAAHLRKHWESNKVHAKGAYTFATVIRSYGSLDNLRGVWNTWLQMKARNIAPASVTLGCMVEALASNGDPEAGYRVIREHMDDPQLKSLVNAVIYCSLLKGFSHQKRFDRVWALYLEMKGEALQFSIVTYNTLVDACARSRDMGRIPAMLDDMAAAGIAPNTITFSAIIKGYCSGPENRMNKALELFEEMKGNAEVHPDEVTYNTLLDGCARFNLWDRGLALLSEMQSDGVRPSNFTLSVLVKLANRCRRPDAAFQLADGLSTKHGIRLNVHVFNNLIHACTLHDDFPRALKVFGRMMDEKVRPDARSYSLLLQGARAAKSPTDAAQLLRAAGGLGGAHPLVRGCAQLAQPTGGLSADTVSEALEGLSSMCTEEPLYMQLIRDLKMASGLPLDRRRLMRSTCMALNRL